MSDSVTDYYIRNCPVTRNYVVLLPGQLHWFDKNRQFRYVRNGNSVFGTKVHYPIEFGKFRVLYHHHQSLWIKSHGYKFCHKLWPIIRVLPAGKWNCERGEKRSKMIFLGLQIIIFGHFSRFLASFKISFSSLQHPTHNTFYLD